MRSIPPPFLTDIREDEVALTFAWARVPRPRTGYLTILGVGVLIQAVDLVRGRRQRNSVRKGSAEINFALDRNMAMVVTSERLLIWRASRPAIKAPVLIGEVARHRIASVNRPFVNDGCKQFHRPSCSLRAGAKGSEFS